MDPEPIPVEGRLTPGASAKDSPKNPPGVFPSHAKLSEGSAAQQANDADSRQAESQAETTIEADPAFTGAGGSGHDDEAYGSDATSRASTSVSSSVRDYAFENNRRYHKFQEGRYHFPNDEPEQEREDMKHAMIVNLCNGRLHYAPLKNPQMVLDVGTGTGIWAIDMGDEYPEAHVLGMDLSPIQPNWVPPNVSFIVDDAEAPWVHPPNTFDFIHIRHLTSSIKDWAKLLSQAYIALKPGGWIEIQELRFVLLSDDSTLQPDDPVDDFIKNVGKGLSVAGVDLLAMERNPNNLQAAGLIDVEQKVFKVPLGVWPRNPKMKTVGLYHRSSIYDGLQGIGMGPFTRGLKWTPEEVEVYLIGVRKGLMNSRVHSYLPFHVVMGQKPLSAA